MENGRNLTRPHPEALFIHGIRFIGAFGVDDFAGLTTGPEGDGVYGYMSVNPGGMCWGSNTSSSFTLSSFFSPKGAVIFFS